MRKMYQSRILLTVMVILLAGGIYLYFFTQDPIDYNAQVKPIINQKCISCHGGVKKKGGFSLLFREEALSPTESGHPAIVPGDAKNSDFIKRLHSTDPEERMPYQEEALTDDEIKILTRWVDEGAKFETHWSYLPVKAPTVPGGGFFGWFSKKDGNEIDRFIDQKLDEIDLARSKQAEKEVLLRRVSLDLIGIPAPANISKQYLEDNSDQAYEKLVDALLASPQFGERWTALWMDLARYADTKGYERDYIRSIWRYRDWLIKAFNEDKPYDQFIIEQLAGDLLPNPSDEQFIATAFHRNTMNNDEGGTDNEEFRVAAILDRVNTTWEALMGTSFACVQCHSHPYDPFTHEEYYKFMAFFNNSRDEDTYDEYPLLREFRNDSKLKYDNLLNWLGKHTDKNTVAFYQRLLKTGQQCINSITVDSMFNAALEDTKSLRFRKNSLAKFGQRDCTNKPNLLIRLNSFVDNGTLKLYVDNSNSKPVASITINKTKKDWDLINFKLDEKLKGKHDFYFRYENPSLKKEKDLGPLVDWLVFTPSFPSINSSEGLAYHNEFLELLNLPDAEFTPIMSDNPDYMKRKTFVFERGNWMIKTKEVEPGIPALFVGNNQSYNSRLKLAEWMTDKQNPLTARTMVNRLWEQLFGQGLVETLEDLGSQGIAPTHPELLDYLAYTFMEDDKWSIKKTLKRMVLSSTYKQSNTTSKEALEKDPLNKYYARAPRVRLTAEQIRDQALAISGKLSKKMYGPSVMPYQPDGIWASPYDGRSWVKSEGEDQYRRAIYTYWKRTGPYPSFINFDGTAREVCTSRRIKTNTPLQALTLLNDSTYWDISVQFAKELMQEKNTTINQKISKGYQIATGIPIQANKTKVLENLYVTTLQQIANDQKRVSKMIADSVVNQQKKELAALAVVTNAILNLDEVITKN
jgi:mono/diheme cytochrome c family protein